MSEVYGHPLYRDMNRRTVQRDIKFLRTHDLVIVDNGTLTPNLDVMDQFTAVRELEDALALPIEPL